MSDLKQLTEENTNRILGIVESLQPVTAKQVQEELANRFGLHADLDDVVRYMEWLRSNFPRKLAHAGPERWIVVDLG